MNTRRLALICFLAYVLLGALLFLRPHQETFIGLDNSAIRMMTQAMAQGRPQIGTDHVLVQAPEELRRHFLYIPDPRYRITRDRSFQLDDLQGCTYRPWFYPFLSYAALTLDRVAPGRGADYFLPSLALAFFVLAGWFMFQRLGPLGLAAALGLILCQPLLPWFARGYYPELAGLLAIMAVALHWLKSENRPSRLYAASFLLGAAVCFHPLLALWAGAMFLLLAGQAGLGARQVLLAAFSWVLGVLPLAVVTQYVTQPYGPLFSPDWLALVFQGSMLFFLFILAALLCLGTFLAMLTSHGRAVFQRVLLSPGAKAHALRLAAALIPLGLLLVSEKTRATTLVGLADLWSLLASPFGLVVGATLLASLHPAVGPRPRALLTLSLALASVFLYLKGVEPFGLWSQRRLLPVAVPFLVAALGIWRDVLESWNTTPWKPRLASGGVLLLAGLVMHLNPSFYLLRSEHGANDLVHELRQATGDVLTIFDYHQYGSPLAALGQGDVLALSNRISEDDRGEVMAWAARQAGHGPVIWVTAYEAPGLEHGVRLEHVQTVRQDLPRLHAKGVFPAAVRRHEVAMHLLSVQPLDPAAPAPLLDKVLDHGALALRGPWGRGDIALQTPDGERLPARWSRQGSAVIGPVPGPGQSVHVELTAAAYRKGDPDHQVMVVAPPWDGPALELHVGNDYTVVSGRLERASHGNDLMMLTGRYTFTSLRPYDPSAEGIHGFDPDLGVLLHRVRIEIIE